MATEIETEIPVIVSVAVRYFWRHCPDKESECGVDTQEDWDKLVDEYDKWCNE